MCYIWIWSGASKLTLNIVLELLNKCVMVAYIASVRFKNGDFESFCINMQRLLVFVVYQTSHLYKLVQ